MKLSVRVIEARNITAMDSNGSTDAYVRVQMGKQKFRTKVVKKSLNPSWGEEFTLRVEDVSDDIVVSVMNEDKFNDDLVGQVKVPVLRVLDSDEKSLPITWYPLLKKSKKNKHKDRGEILLALWFSMNNSFADLCARASDSSNHTVLTMVSPPRSFNGPSGLPSPVRQTEVISSKEEKPCAQKTLASRIAQIFQKNSDTYSPNSAKDSELSDIAETNTPEDRDNNSEDNFSSCNFEEAMRTMESRDVGSEVPANLPGGLVLDQSYVISPSDLNSLLFSPDSSFPKSFADLQGTTELQQGPWNFDDGGENLKRVITYIKAATKLIKAVKGTEEQTYLKADGKCFVVLASISIPDVMCGSTFKTEVMYCVKPGPELPSGEQSSQLSVSWRLNFVQSTMMKGMIENGARQGLKESFEQFGILLSQNVKPVELKDIGSNKELVLASLQAEPQSDWKLGLHYFSNFTFLSTLFLALYILVHICLTSPTKVQGLEFVGLDLPDSIGECIVCGVLVLQGERALRMISRFMHARVQKGSDHGVKALGDGWLLTVALIDGCNIAAVDSSSFSDPYVVFMCNGKPRSSSIKFQNSNPQWNEIFEFDAMDEPPSMLDVEVYDFDGPFDEATSLGHGEINFVRSNISDLADLWLPLQGKLAQACQSKLHLRIFLDNTRQGNVVKEYLNKMEKEVGKKINLRSPQTNSAFQKLFGLPPEEFLINDFTCHLKRKMPLQGRLFLSARVLGFHANLFGHKTNFFFLWEDIEDIQVVAPTLASMGSPIILIILWKGRGMDAKHGAKTHDAEGRLKFHFQSFVSFNVAHRTIMALWKARSLSPEQKVRIIEEESDAKSLQTDDTDSCLGLDEVSMSEIHSSTLSVPTSFFMEQFNGSELERKAMEKAGCLNYSHTPWESEKDDVYERQIYYRYDEHISRYGGEVTSTQQRRPFPNKNGWFVEEVITLHSVPLGDFFNLHLRYQVEDLNSKAEGCNVKVFFGVAWLKSTKHQKRITKNILKNVHNRLKITFGVVEKKFLRQDSG